MKTTMTPNKLSLIVSTSLLTLAFSPLQAGGIGGSSGSSSHLYGMEAETISTSSDFDRHSINLNYGSQQGEAGFGGTAAHHRIDDEYASYRANEVKVRAGHQLNDTFYIEGGVGANRIKSRHYNHSKSLTSYQVGARAKLSDQVSVGLEHEKDLVYRDQIIENEHGEILSAKTTRADVKFRPAERVRLEGESEYRKFSDGNSSKGYKVGAYYGISPNWPWIWTGVEYSNLDFKHQDSGYWTPENHRAVAATLSASFPVNDSLSMNGSVNVNRNRNDNSNETNTGYYASLGADLKLSPNSTLSAKAHHIKSQQEASDWDETGANIGLKFNHY